MRWDRDFGGKRWQTIARAWAPLLDARLPHEKFIQIDHVIDLTHNGGTSFLEKGLYEDDQRRLRIALYKKANTRNPLKLPKISREIREMIIRFMPGKQRDTDAASK